MAAQSKNSGQPIRRGRGRPPGSKDSRPRKRKNAARTASARRSPRPVNASGHVLPPRGELPVSARAKATQVKKVLILEGLAAGLSVTGACTGAGTHRSSYCDWLRTDPDFAARVEDALERGTDTIEDALLADAMKPGQWVAKLAIVKARRPARWSDRQQLQVQTIEAPDTGALRRMLDDMRSKAVELLALKVSSDRSGNLPMPTGPVVIDVTPNTPAAEPAKPQARSPMQRQAKAEPQSPHEEPEVQSLADGADLPPHLREIEARLKASINGREPGWSR